MSDFRIVAIDSAQAADMREIARRLMRYNEQHAGAEGYAQVFLALKDPAGGVRGGVVGFASWRWLTVDVLWVDRDLRGQGQGRELLAGLEAWGRAQGCGAVLVDTFSFQAEGFYLKQGYAVVARLPDYPPGHERIYLTKSLA